MILQFVQPYYREANWIWTLWGTRGEHATLNRIHEGGDKERESIASVEVINQNDMRKAFEILQSLGELGKHLYRALDAGCSGRLYRCAFSFMERAMDYPDLLIFNHYDIFLANAPCIDITHNYE